MKYSISLSLIVAIFIALAPRTATASNDILLEGFMYEIIDESELNADAFDKTYDQYTCTKKVTLTSPVGSVECSGSGTHASSAKIACEYADEALRECIDSTCENLDICP